MKIISKKQRKHQDQPDLFATAPDPTPKDTTSKPLILIGIIKQETDKAILIEYEETNPPEMKQIWLPISQITITNSTQSQGNLFGAPTPQKTITIPGWLAKEKRLI